jgi:acetyl esterase
MISEHDRQVLSQLPVWNPTGEIVAQRRAWEELATVYNQDLPAIGGLEEKVELRPGLRADVAVPKGAGPHPVVIYLHGGGWAFGSPTSFRKLGMQFAEAGYLTIVLDYRLAPEHPFPAALEDSIFAIGWAADNARRWNGDGRRIAIGGDSAGGNLAVSALTSSAPDLRSLVRAAVLFYGAYDLEATAERTRSLPGLQEQLSTYVSGKRDLFDDPRLSPLKAVAPGILPPVLHRRSGRRLLVSRRLAGAWPSPISRCEPLRAARDGRNTARVHADEHARDVPRGHALDVGVPGAQRLNGSCPPLTAGGLSRRAVVGFRCVRSCAGIANIAKSRKYGGRCRD